MTTILLSVLAGIWYAVQVALLWLLADFITGIVHWWQDTYGNPSWPIIGKYVVIPNLNHHKNPRGMVKDSYWDRVKASVVGGVIVIALLYGVCGWHSWRLVLCVALGTQGNQIHVWAHRTNKENGRFVMMLQTLGIFQSRKMHGWHHSAPYDTNFFIMTDYLNPLSNKIRFFERLESLIKVVIGVYPLRGSSVRDGV